jgi:LysM repeat protein
MSPVFAHVPVTHATAQPQPAAVRAANPAPHGWVPYTVRRGDTVGDLAARYRTSNGVVVTKNGLRNGGRLISVGQRLWLPRTPQMAAAEAAKARAAKAQAAARREAAIRASTYVVRPGDTLSEIAAKRGVPLASMLKANRLSTRSTIYPGQRLRVAGPAARATPAVTRRAASTATTGYRVRQGDTLSHVAARTGTPLNTLLRLNRLTRQSIIHPGQRLTVRASAPAARKSPAPRRTTAYTVRAGDTLSHIALRTGTTQAALLKLNGLADANRLSAGQRLRIPVKPPRTAASSNSFAGRTYPDHVVQAAARNRARLSRAAVPSRSATKAMIVATARRHGVDPALALAISWQESGWNQSQVSVANAIGTMQVIPSSGEWASQLAGRRLDLLDTRDNITAGVVIIRALTRSAGSLDQAIAGYYQGLASVQRNGMYPDTKQYVASIKAHRARM